MKVDDNVSLRKDLQLLIRAYYAPHNTTNLIGIIMEL